MESAFPRAFGPYVLVRALGGGGMGDVCLAIRGQPGMEKLCVVKRLMPDARENSERRARFQREAMLVRRLSHGAIAQTLAITEVAGELVIVQEFIDGRNLTQVLATCTAARDWPPVPVAVHIAREVARALAYAHRFDGRGVMHRDVAPDNIMLAFDGEVKLVDFGIARAPSDPYLTAPGHIVGRHTYTAPELRNGGVGDGRADIYSLGVVLWKLLAGRSLSLPDTAPFPPPPSAVRTFCNIPPSLDALTLRALARLPEDRFKTGEDVQQALGTFLPPGFVGEQAVAAFLQQHYDVTHDRQRLEEDLEGARQLLGDASMAFPPPPKQPLPLPSNRAIRLRLGFAVLGIVVFGGIYWAKRRRPTPRPAPNPPVALPPSRPPAVGPLPAAPSGPPAPVRMLPAGATNLLKDAPGTRAQISPQRSRPAALLLESATESLDSGDFVAAARLADEALRLGTPGQKARAHVILGQVLLERSGKLAAAEREFETALLLDPTNAAAADKLGALRYRRRNWPIR